MSLFDRRALVLLPLALAACGFQPAYAPDGTAAALHGKVRVDAPDGVLTYFLVRRLEEQLGRAQVPVYRLSIVLTTGIQGQAILASGDITFYSVVGNARFVLRHMETDQIVASGEVDNFTGYSATGSTTETLAAQRDARERLMVILADQIARELYVTTEIPE